MGSGSWRVTAGSLRGRSGGVEDFVDDGGPGTAARDRLGTKGLLSARGHRWLVPDGDALFGVM